MRDKYGVSLDHYCYPDSDTLKNQLNIQDSDALDGPEVSKDHWLEANIQGYHGNLSLLEELFDRAISQTNLL